MSSEETEPKILYLKEMIHKGSDQNKGRILRTISELFQLNQKGGNFSPETVDFINESANQVLSPELKTKLSKLRLDGYAFLFAAMNFVDIEDVIDDISNGGDILKSNPCFPPGAFSKLKRELLGSSKPVVEESAIQEQINKNGNEELVKEKGANSSHCVEERSYLEAQKQPAKFELLKKLIMQQNPGNKGKILGALKDLVRDDYLSTLISSDDGKEVVKQAASVILSAEMNELLEKLCLEEYSYVLAVNYITDLNALADEVLHGDLLQQNLPRAAFNNLKRELSAIKDSLQAQETPINTIPESSLSDESISLPTNLEPTKSRLALQIKGGSRCQRLPETTNGMEIYQLQLTRNPAKNVSSTERWVFGTPKKTNVKCKTILLMGATGSGKTTLINSMVNYILGVDWEDPFRFMLIREENTSTNQAHSQTSRVTAYELHYEAGFRVPYSLIIVDTPGYGDTKGVDRDHQITETIQQFFKDEKGIQELDAVGFLAQAALARLTPTQKYIFDSILSIFGNDIENNISFLVTFADGQTPPVLDAIKEAKITKQLDKNGQPHHHRFNNSGFFASNQAEDENNGFGQMFWKLGMKNFESFFSVLSNMATRSLTLTKEVLEERKHINVTIEGLTTKIQRQLTKMEELRKTKQMIENHSDQIKANKDFKYTVTVSKGDKFDITDNTCTTNCSKCSMSCHFPCQLGLTEMKQGCAAMGKDGLCKVCPKNCKWDEHLNQSYHWVFKDVSETKTYEEIRKKYESALHQKLTTEGVLQALQLELKQIQYDLKQDIKTITDCLQRLDRIALRPDAFTTTEYIELMIQAETKEKKPGYQERIKSLKSLLDKTQIVSDIRTGKYMGKYVSQEAEEAAAQSCSQLQITAEPKKAEKKTGFFNLF